jgi:hypothetical protein
MKELLEKWQKILDLDDWTIALEDGCYELSVPESAGCAEYSEVGRFAKIQMLAPEAYGDRIVPYDREQTLVHELLHLKLCLLQDTGNELQNRVVHQLIDDLARSFVKANRQN